MPKRILNLSKVPNRKIRSTAKRHRGNPLFVKNGKRAMLTGGFDTWLNLIDDFADGVHDFSLTISEMKRFNHNHIRLWAWDARGDEVFDIPGGEIDLTPTRYKQSQTSGLFNLQQINPEFIIRLRARVEACLAEDIYCTIMMVNRFGWTDGAWAKHPYNPTNNSSNVNGGPTVDGFYAIQNNPLLDAAQRLLMDAIVEATLEYPNVMYEVGNELRDTAWQKKIVSYLKKIAPRRVIWINTCSHCDTAADLWSANPTGIELPLRSKIELILEIPKRLSKLNTDHDSYSLTTTSRKRKRETMMKAAMRGLHLGLMVDHQTNRPDNWYPGLKFDHQAVIDANRCIGICLALMNKSNLKAMRPLGTLHTSSFQISSTNEGFFYTLDRREIRLKTGDLQNGRYFFDWTNPITGQVLVTHPKGKRIADQVHKKFVAPWSEALLRFYHRDLKDRRALPDEWFES